MTWIIILLVIFFFAVGAWLLSRWASRTQDQREGGGDGKKKDENGKGQNQKGRSQWGLLKTLVIIGAAVVVVFVAGIVFIMVSRPSLEDSFVMAKVDREATEPLVIKAEPLIGKGWTNIRVVYPRTEVILPNNVDFNTCSGTLQKPYYKLLYVHRGSTKAVPATGGYPKDVIVIHLVPTTVEGTVRMLFVPAVQPRVYLSSCKVLSSMENWGGEQVAPAFFFYSKHPHGGCFMFFFRGKTTTQIQ